MVENKQCIQYSDVVFFKGYPSPESLFLTLHSCGRVAIQ